MCRMSGVDGTSIISGPATETLLEFDHSDAEAVYDWSVDGLLLWCAMVARVSCCISRNVVAIGT